MPTHTDEPVLHDRFGRRIEYLRLSITERCDLRCFYCLPRGYRDRRTPDHWLRADEIERLVRAMVGLGVRRVRVTGGEPLTRHDALEVVQRLGRIEGLEDLSLSTNATRLARLAGPLYAAGVRRLNVSLDSLRPERFRAISGGRLEKVLDGLEAARAAGFAPIKINMVAMKGINDDELDDMIDFCAERGFVLRLIETMPMGETGREAQARYLDLQTVRRALERRHTLVPQFVEGGGPARNYRLAERNLDIGFITPISRHFCDSCNRVRLTAGGTMHLCLGQEHRYPFRELLRAGIDDEALQAHILKAIERKPERHEFRERPERVIRFMAHTGG